MKVNWNYVLGATTIVGVVGFTIYAIKKSKEQAEVEEASMSVEEAMALVKSKREQSMDETKEDFEEMVDEIRDTAGFNRSFMRSDEEIKEYAKQWDKDIFPEEQEDEDEEEPEFLYDEIENFEVPLNEIMTEEDKVLKHDPNSNEARNQYIRMELADWTPMEDEYSILLTLFQYPFVPKNDGDEDLRMKLIDYRVNFFGVQSKWCKEITMADVLLHYVRMTVYNLDEDARYWMDYFLQFNDFDTQMTRNEMIEVIDALNSHTYYNTNTNTFGLFGLTQEYMASAIKVASRNIDQQVNYEIEFNEFLKSCM